MKEVWTEILQAVPKWTIYLVISLILVGVSAIIAVLMLTS